MSELSLYPTSPENCSGMEILKLQFYYMSAIWNIHSKINKKINVTEASNLHTERFEFSIPAKVEVGMKFGLLLYIKDFTFVILLNLLLKLILASLCWKSDWSSCQMQMVTSSPEHANCGGQHPGAAVRLLPIGHHIRVSLVPLLQHRPSYLFLLPRLFVDCHWLHSALQCPGRDNHWLHLYVKLLIKLTSIVYPKQSFFHSDCCSPLSVIKILNYLSFRFHVPLTLFYYFM